MSARYPDFDGTQSCAEVGTEAFFPDQQNSQVENAQAKAVCGGCSWVGPCLEYALHWNVVGIWGATTPLERKTIRRRRKITAQPVVPPDRAAVSERVKQLTARGMTAAEIAIVMGITERSVQRNRGAA